MEIEKAYFTLPEILDRWAISEADLIYLAENDKLRLSVRVFGVPLELGDYEETDGGEHFRIPIEQSHYSGLLELHARDVFQLFRVAELTVSDFRTPRSDYASICGDRDGVPLTIEDLLLRRVERDRFEAETGFSGAETGPQLPVFSASPDYHEVRCTITRCAAAGTSSVWARSRRRLSARCMRLRTVVRTGRAARPSCRRRDQRA
jgi:hypothetical protein